MFLFEFPFVYLRIYTIPSSGEDTYNKCVAMCHPTTIAVFICWYWYKSDYFTCFIYAKAFGAFNWIYIILIEGFIFAIIIFCTSHRNQLPSYSLIYSIVGFIMSIIWINLVADYLMNFLNLIALLSGLREDFLGLTLLAWGNSLGDLFAN